MDFWLQPKIQELIAVVLAEICDDNWRLQFEPTKFREAGGGHQRRLELKSSLDVKRLALFSGGLDSVAGLASRIVGQPAYALVTVAHQSSLRRRTGNQIEASVGISVFLPRFTFQSCWACVAERQLDSQCRNNLNERVHFSSPHVGRLRRRCLASRRLNYSKTEWA